MSNPWANRSRKHPRPGMTYAQAFNIMTQGFRVKLKDWSEGEWLDTDNADRVFKNICHGNSHQRAIADLTLEELGSNKWVITK